MSRAALRLRQHLAIGFGALILLTFSLGPFIWIFIASITPEADNLKPWSSVRQSQYFPSQPTGQNYLDLFKNVPFERYFRNSVIVASGTTALALSVASLGAYAFARFRFPGRAPLLVGMLLVYLVPSVVLLVPLLVIFRTYGLINTYQGLILAEATHTAPFALLLMINYFSALPAELEEAALVDGCGRLGALFRIVLPLAVPGLVAAGLFVFIAAWNNFLFAFLFATGDEVKTLPVVMRLFALGEPAVWGVSAAGAIVTTLPVAALFLGFQKLLINGLSAGAVKG